MAGSKIDINRGVTIKSGDKPTSFPIYMYKDEPGVFLNTYGDPVPDELAAEAGFDVESLSKTRELKRRMKEAYDEIRAELELQGDEEQIIREKDGLKVVPFGKHYHLKDAAGNVLSPIPLDKDSAFLLLDKLTAPTKPTEKKPSAKEKARKEAETEE